MSLNNALIYPANKLSNYIKKESITKNSTNIINLILPNNNTNISNYRLIENFDKYNPKINNNVFSYLWFCILTAIEPCNCTVTNQVSIFFYK